MTLAGLIDSDQHLYEPRSMWLDHIDPADRDLALTMVDDDAGYTWLTWQGEKLGMADIHRPGDTASVGEHRNRRRRGEPSEYRYDDDLPASYWDPSARVTWLDDAGFDSAVCFPNFGLLWERRLTPTRSALLANMKAWNRWCASVVADSGGRLHPVAHLSLSDPEWLLGQLAELEAAGVKLAMIAPAPVDGRPLSHPDHERLWAAFVDHGISPVFHVADQPRVFDDCWYVEPDSLVPTVESVFLWVPPALAITDLITSGVFDRHPRLRVGIVELSAIWVPQFMLMLDGAVDFTSKLNGLSRAELAHRPSDYLARNIRVASFSYENPARLTRQAGDLFMACSDFPHSEGTATPLADYERAGCTPDPADAMFGANARFLLGDG